MAWALLACYGIAHYFGLQLSSQVLLYLCPPSIAAMGLEHASLLVGILGWLLISTVNALLYAIPGGFVALCVSLLRLN
jgi:hypothetical protein